MSPLLLLGWFVPIQSKSGDTKRLGASAFLLKSTPGRGRGVEQRSYARPQTPPSGQEHPACRLHPSKPSLVRTSAFRPPPSAASRAPPAGPGVRAEQQHVAALILANRRYAPSLPDVLVKLHHATYFLLPGRRPRRPTKAHARKIMGHRRRSAAVNFSCASLCFCSCGVRGRRCACDRHSARWRGRGGGRLVIITGTGRAELGGQMGRLGTHSEPNETGKRSEPQSMAAG